MESGISPKKEDSNLSLLDQDDDLPQLVKEKVNLEDFEFQNDYDSSTLFVFTFSTFSPNISTSLLSIAFVFERNGLIPSSLTFLYGFLSHIVFSNMLSKQLHYHQKRSIIELMHEKFIFEKYYKIFSVFYYFCFQMFLVIVFKDILSSIIHFLADKNGHLFLDSNKSLISSVIFFLSSFVISLFSKSSQISMLVIFSLLSCLSICFLAARCYYLNYINKYGSNRSLQIDTLNSNLFTSFSYFHFALSLPPLFLNNKYCDASECSLNGFLTTFVKFLFLAVCGYSMYVTYGRYINSTQLFSFHDDDVMANFCRLMYMVATISMNVVFVNQLKTTVGELFENNFVDLIFHSYKNVASLLFLIMPVLFSFVVHTSLPFISICGAISFWGFEVVFPLLFSLFVNENGLKTCQNCLKLSLVVVAILIFAVTVFCAIRDMIVYYQY